MRTVQGGKIKQLDTRNEYQVAVDTMKEVLPYALELFPPQAKALKAKFDSLVAEGFTLEQALEIVKTRPIFE
ncbi:phage protein [Bacillus sp. OxB-1]|uniref:hypothetical protein n=1 Tax=Bacillus sp. (strain OxB-1) TaxID=98228 RepID=UPI000581CF0D|nr:hypothetical protein [Bacillus sp. OxB-1]BAQ11313.1 phage protein [Bacillus sp. OxB-1]